MGRAVAFREVQDALFADAACTDLRFEVALAFLRRAHIEQDEVEHLAVELAAAHDADRRNANAFLEYLGRRAHGAGKGAAHIRMMRAVGDVEGRFGRRVGEEDGQNHGDVRKVSAAGVGVVEDGDVAGREVDCGDGGRNRHGHGAEMHGHMVAHGDDTRPAVEDCAGVVAAFFDVGRERGAAQGCAHLLGDGVDGALEDGEFDWIDDGVRGHGVWSCKSWEISGKVMTRLPSSSTSAWAWGGRTMAEVYSAIMVGPGMRSPGVRASR